MSKLNKIKVNKKIKSTREAILLNKIVWCQRRSRMKIDAHLSSVSVELIATVLEKE